MNDGTYPWMFLRMLKHGFNHLYKSSTNKSTKKKRQLKADEDIHIRDSISADYYKEVLASLSTVCWPVWRNLLPVYPVSPPPHPPSCWINERVRGEWEEGSRAGETVLIHIMTSVEDTVCFHWGSLSTLCPKVFCCTTTKLQILNTFFFDATDRDIYPDISSWRCSSSVAIIDSCLDSTPTIQPLCWLVSQCIVISETMSHYFYG